MTDVRNYLVWSNEHRAWWKAGYSGYSVRLEEAGRYTRFEAFKICRNAQGGWTGNTPPPEIPVRLQDALLTCSPPPRHPVDMEDLRDG